MANNEITKEIKHFLRLSSQRELYTIPQASFRLNCSRNEFEDLFVRCKIKIVISNGKKMIPHSEIDSYIEHLKHYTDRKVIES